MTFSIQPNQTLGIFAPSSSIVPERFEVGCAVLRDRGFQLLIHPQTYTGADTGTQWAGTPENKATAFMDLWENPKVDAIMAACGGNFASQFLHLLDFKSLITHPKPVLGFSDTTALLTALYARSHIGGFFAPTVQNLQRVAHHNTIFDILSGAPDTLIDMPESKTIVDGTTPPSPVFAATLSVLISLIGTPYFPDLTGHILILEDVGEEFSHLDRMLWQLNTVSPFANLAGLVLGEFVDTKDTGRPFGMDFEGIVRKYTQSISIPVVINAPIGHGVNLRPIPLGRLSVLDATNRNLILL